MSALLRRLLDRLRDEPVVTSVTAPPTPVGATWTDPFTGTTYRITRHRRDLGHPWGGLVHYGVRADNPRTAA